MRPQKRPGLQLLSLYSLGLAIMEVPCRIRRYLLLYSFISRKQLNVSLKSLTATIELLDEGSTVPFIARYRKEVTGNLDEVQIRIIEEKLAYFRELEDRRKTVLETIDAQGKLTPELRARIESVLEKTELEDLYLPYKPKRRTKASIAREKGLEPLAQYLWDQVPGAIARWIMPRLSLAQIRTSIPSMRLSRARDTSLPNGSAKTLISARRSDR